MEVDFHGQPFSMILFGCGVKIKLVGETNKKTAMMMSTTKMMQMRKFRIMTNQIPQAMTKNINNNVHIVFFWGEGGCFIFKGGGFTSEQQCGRGR